MPKNNSNLVVLMTRRELATVLAGLRLHQAQNLQPCQDIPASLHDIATDGSHLRPLDAKEVDKLCQRLNLSRSRRSLDGLVIDPPQNEGGKEPLFRVVYVIDVNAKSPLRAAKEAHKFMIDPGSGPVLEVIDHRGESTSIDLSLQSKD